MVLMGTILIIIRKMVRVRIVVKAKRIVIITRGRRSKILKSGIFVSIW